MVPKPVGEYKGASHKTLGAVSYFYDNTHIDTQRYHETNQFSAAYADIALKQQR